MLVVPGGTVLRVRRWTLKLNGEADSSVVAAVTVRPITLGIVSGAACAPRLTVTMTCSPLDNVAPDAGSVEMTRPTFTVDELIDTTFGFTEMPVLAILES